MIYRFMSQSLLIAFIAKVNKFKEQLYRSVQHLSELIALSKSIIYTQEKAWKKWEKMSSPLEYISE